MLATSCARQQRANLIDLAPAAWDQLYPGPGMGMSTLVSTYYTKRQKNRRNA